MRGRAQKGGRACGRGGGSAQTPPHRRWTPRSGRYRSGCGQRHGKPEAISCSRKPTMENPAPLLHCISPPAEAPPLTEFGLPPNRSAEAQEMWP